MSIVTLTTTIRCSVVSVTSSRRWYMSDTSVLAELLEGVKFPDDVTLESSTNLECNRVGKFLVQPKETTEQLLTPQLMETINKVYKLNAHRDELINNGNITFAIATEVFSTLALDGSNEVNKCTKHPSRSNYDNILSKINSQLQLSWGELQSTTLTSSNQVIELTNMVVEIVDEVYNQIDSTLKILNPVLINLGKTPHIVKLYTGEFVHVMTIPLDKLASECAYKIDWERYNGKLGELAYSVYNSKVINFLFIDEMSGMVYTLDTLLSKLLYATDNLSGIKDSYKDKLKEILDAAYYVNSNITNGQLSSSKLVDVQLLEDFIHKANDGLPVLLGLLDTQTSNLIAHDLTNLIELYKLID